MDRKFEPSTAPGRAAEGKLKTGFGNSVCQQNLNVEVYATFFFFGVSQFKFGRENLTAIILNYVAYSDLLDKVSFFTINNAPLLSHLNWGAYYVEL